MAESMFQKRITWLRGRLVGMSFLINDVSTSKSKGVWKSFFLLILDRKSCMQTVQTPQIQCQPVISTSLTFSFLALLLFLYEGTRITRPTKYGTY